MANIPPPAAEQAADQASGRPTREQTSGDLNLLLAWPAEAPSRWRLAVAASVALHVVAFFVVLQLETIMPKHHPQAQKAVSVTHLYLPPDLLTQRAPNRTKPSKTFDLGGLVAPRSSIKPLPSPQPGKTKQIEAVKTPSVAKETVHPPQITPEAPKQTASAEPVSPPPGVPDAVVSAPPPPTPVANPVPQPGTREAPLNKPRLAPPNNSIQDVLHQMARQSGPTGISVTDETPAPSLPARPGQQGSPARMKSSIELKSDPQGVDFRPYLANILAIVRRNWFSVLPDSARMGVLRGRTTIQFVVNRDGSIPKLIIADPSGLQPLDRAAVAGLSMSNPLPPLPAGFKGGSVDLQFSFNYNMPSF